MQDSSAITGLPMTDTVCDEGGPHQTVSSRPPRISVLMAAHNAAPWLRQSILSILGQTYADFELIVVDDASSDGTAAIVQAIADPRVRLIACPTNIGAVRARNAGFALARGTYLAIQDADDISHPTRLARQVAHLERDPACVLVASDIRQMHPGGEMIVPRTGGPASALLLDWMLHLGNPIGFSATMMRMSALRRLPEFLREQRRYAEDYDLYARLRAHGAFFRLSEPLLIYRVHPASCSSRNHALMIEQTGRVLADIWARDLSRPGSDGHAAALIARTIGAGMPAQDAQALRMVRDSLSSLIQGFLDSHPDCDAAEREAVAAHAGRLWEGLVRASLRAGTITWAGVPFFRPGTRPRLRGRDLFGAALRGKVPRRLLAMLRPGARAQAEPVALAPPQAPPVATIAPPVLFAAVVLHGASGAAAGRGDAAFFMRAQAIFERYGLRPAYLADAALARQATICQTLRRVHEDGDCGIGAWWDDKADRHSVRALTAAITAACGVPPSYTTTEAAACIPIASGQPDPVADLIAVPLTRFMVVPLAPVIGRIAGSAMDQSCGLPERDDLAQDVALLPDRVASEPQIMLMRSMLARGERRFFLRLHLRQDDAHGGAALDRLSRVCAWFFEDLGGLPGDISSLTADRRRRPRADAIVHIQTAS